MSPQPTVMAPNRYPGPLPRAPSFAMSSRSVSPMTIARSNPIGRYEFEDTHGLINGKLYFYAVTSFGITQVPNDVTGEMDEVELAGLPSAVEGGSGDTPLGHGRELRRGEGGAQSLSGGVRPGI